MQVKCNKCGYVGDESEFPKGRDFFQHRFIKACANPECDNQQNPGDASLRMMPGMDHPFTYVRPPCGLPDAASRVLYLLTEAS